MRPFIELVEGKTQRSCYRERILGRLPFAKYVGRMLFEKLEILSKRHSSLCMDCHRLFKSKREVPQSP